MNEFIPATDYNHRQRTTFERHELEKFVGDSARLPLTGRIVEVRESTSGPFVMFEPDARWGLPADIKLGFDMEAFDWLGWDDQGIHHDPYARNE